MTYSEKRKLYEQIIWTIARIVKSSITQLDDKHLNESIVNINDISQQFISAIKYALNETFNVLNEVGRTRYWTEEKIKDYLSQHSEIKTRSDFAKSNNRAYKSAIELQIIDNLFDSKKHNWSKEQCSKCASECKYRSEFMAKYWNIYCYAKKHNWLEEITTHMPKQKFEELYPYNDYIVYVYEEPITHSAYVGLTNNMTRRDYQHKTPTKDGYDTLGRYCLEHNVDIPKYIILKSNLNSSEARRYEFKYWYQYRDNGWNMINSERLLGYLGGGSRHWSKETIFDFIEKHPNIKTRTQLQKISDSAYKTANKLGIMDELFGQKRLREKYTEDEIKQFLKEHPEIINRRKLQDVNQSIYRAAKNLEILDDLFGESLKISWTEEKIKDYLSKHPEIKTKTDLAKSKDAAYKKAKELGIIDKLFSKNK